MRTAAEGAAALAAALRAFGGDLAAALAPEAERPAAGDGPGPAQIAASGPRAQADPAAYELLIEMIREGAALHYGRPAVLAPADPDLGLLLGDQLYALGLARLAERGDLEAVAELADVISLVSAAHAAGTPELAEAVWAAGARAIGWGADFRHEQAKQLARTGDPRAAQALSAAAAGPGS
ncbi:MAG TPA: hypothetical protein VFN55_06070 [Solirubrobacteraceae bacterium]|nr:hypothetical protein [Solirubrobacteraceae bacterium]